jgi:hypothetical protein
VERERARERSGARIPPFCSGGVLSRPLQDGGERAASRSTRPDRSGAGAKRSVNSTGQRNTMADERRVRIPRIVIASMAPS